MNDLPVNIVDIAVVAVLLISAVFAYARGLIHEVLSIGGWIGAIFATIYGFKYVEPYTRQIIPIELAAQLAAGVIVFIFTLVVLSLLTRMISKHIQESSLNVLDRSLGFLFGLVRGAVIICLVYLGLEYLMARDEHPVWIQEAKSTPLIIQGATFIKRVVPQDIEIPMPDVPAAVPTTPEKVIQQLLTPPAADQGSSNDGAYGNKERSELNRVYENLNGN